MYHDDIKEWFLETLDHEQDETRGRVEWTLTRAEEWEEMFGKSLVDFSLEELMSMFVGFRSSSPASLRSMRTQIKKYIEFASGKLGKTVGQIGLLDSEMLKDAISDRAKSEKYLTREILFNKIESLNNNTEKLILALLFEGIRGKAYQDIINIKLEDVNVNSKTITIASTGEIFKMEDDRVWELIMSAWRRETSIGTLIKEDSCDVGSMYDYLILREINSPGLPMRDGLRHVSLRPHTTHSIKITIQGICNSIELPFTRGVDIQVSGYAEKIWEKIKVNNDKLSTAVVQKYIKELDIRVNFENVILAIEQLYL